MEKTAYSPLSVYIGKIVTVTDKWGYKYYKERVIAIDSGSLVTEYHHWLKTPEDGLLREHWIQIKNIESITLH